MGLKQIAKILYNMSLDMDYADSIEHYETEVAAITQELQDLTDVEMPYLLAVLERIAEQNENMENWLESKIQED